MPNPNPASPRMTFQWRYLEEASRELKPDGWPDNLNVGCADDPLGFGECTVHFDLDDWSARHKFFVQGNAHKLPFGDKSFDTVIAGDILEHVREPMQVTKELLRVARRRVCLTVFEEWKLPDFGCFIEEGAANSEKMSKELGYKGREDYQIQNFPDRIGFPDDEEPHLIHIQQFSDEYIDDLVAMCKQEGFRVLEYHKAFEVLHEDHNIYNWLIGLEREVPA